MKSPVAPCDVHIGCQGDLIGYGGAAVLGRSLAVACAGAGWGTLLLGLGARPADPVDSPAGYRAWNVAAPPLPLLWRVHNWCLPWLLARQLRSLAPPRVAFVSLSPFWVVAAKRAWPAVPVVWRFCGLLSNCLPFTRLPGQARRLWERIGDASLRNIEHAALRQADAILVPAREHAEELAAFEPSAADRAVECLESCDRFETPPERRRAQRRWLGLADSDFLLLAIGSFDRNKAFDHALRELAQTDPRVHLALVGDGPQRADLERLTLQLGLAPRVHVLGRQAELDGWYAACDCVVSTSFYDTFPNIVKEGLTCGRPVIVPNHDPPRVYAGVAGLLRRAEAGLLYDRLRPGALAEQVMHLLHHPRTAMALATRGRQVARRRFTWDGTLDQIARVAGTPPHSTGQRPVPQAPVTLASSESPQRPHSQRDRPQGHVISERNP